METIIFEKDESVKALTLDQLKQTCSIADAGGRLPNSRPLEHFQFIEDVIERLDRNNIQFEMDPIWVAKGDSGRIPKLDPEKKGNIESWVFPRLVTRLNMILGDNTRFNPSIAIGYNVKGLTLGMGVNTRICSNQSIFGNFLLQTWGKTSVHFEKLFNVFNDWLSKYDETYIQNVNILNSMEKTTLNHVQINEMIGELQMEAVKNAYINPGLNTPFNISQMSNFSKNLYQSGTLEKSHPTVFDFYNVGTDLLKPKTTDIVDIWANNNIFSNYIVNRFNLGTPVIEAEVFNN